MTDHPFDDELLSAYIDGELSGEELAQVESRLAEDPQSRQLVEEFRALSQQVQALPADSLDQDFRQSVLQNAERAMLLGEQVPVTQAQTELRSAPSRRWVWAAMTLAASLLLTMVLPNLQQEDEPIARVESMKAEPSKKVAAAATDRNSDRRELSFRSLETPSVPPHVVGDDAGEQQDATEPLAVVESSDGVNTAEITDQLAIDKDRAFSKSRRRMAESDGLSDSSGAISSSISGGGIGGGGFGGGGFGGESSDADISIAASSPVFSANEATSGVASKRATASLKSDTSVASTLQLTCEVHITLRDGEESLQEFDDKLARQGIELESTNLEGRESNESSRLSRAAAQKQLANQARAPQEEPSTQLVLAEAPIDSIEGLVKACNIDPFNCPTIEVIADRENAKAPPVERLRQWERSAGQFVKLPDQPKASELRSRQNVPRGRAQRFGGEQYQQLRQRRLAENRATQREQQQQTNSSDGEHAMPGLSGDQPVQVLFVLRQQVAGDKTKTPLPTTAPSDEPAAR